MTPAHKDNPESKGHHGNFEDAWGLVGRMVRSRDSSAWWALGLAGVGILAKPLDALLKSKEQRALEQRDERTGPMLLIVGAPRSGTTLAYQLFASTLDVSHFTNATGLFFNAPVLGSALLTSTKPKPQKKFHSYYGNSAGLSGTNDGFGVWNRWLGDDRYGTPQTLDEETARDMRKFFSLWQHKFKRPFVNKNNRNADCVELLAKALPQACIVEIHRDPVWVAQSLLKARQTVQGDQGRNWGLRSVEASALSDDPLEQVCHQLRLIEERLSASRERIDSARYLRIGYEDLCENPGAAVHRVVEHFTSFQVRPGMDVRSLPAFEISRKLVTSDQDRQRIEQFFGSPSASDPDTDGVTHGR